MGAGSTVVPIQPPVFQRPTVAHTTSVIIGGEHFHLTTRGRVDGTLDEVLITWEERSQACTGILLHSYAAALSTALQYGVPLLDLIHQGLDLCFVPNGPTDDPQLPWVRSVADWVARRLAIDWLPGEARTAEAIVATDERPSDAELGVPLRTAS